MNKYEYEINYRKPGIVVIFNNSRFLKNKFKEREGSENDVRRLRKVFSDLNFEIETHLDLPAKEIERFIQEYANRDYSTESCFICFIMSHGNNGTIKTSDNQDIYISDFVEPFKYNESLKYKPKLFFLQACRANSGITNVPGHHLVSDDDLEEAPVKLTIGQDFLFCNSTLKGYLSYRDPMSGSLYIQKLCDVICEDPYVDILQILTRVNSHLYDTEIMIPHFDSRLKKTLFIAKKDQPKQV